MNKIDSMWDDLSEDGNFEASIRSQIKTSASVLNIEETAIFPISAKQALLAKVKSDNALLEKSRLHLLENYLSSDILKHRREFLLDTIKRDIGFLVNESSNLTDTRLANAGIQKGRF